MNLEKPLIDINVLAALPSRAELERQQPGRTFANSHFKRVYDATPAPQYQHEVSHAHSQQTRHAPNQACAC